MKLGDLVLDKRLLERKNWQLFRTLPPAVEGIDFASNDYLGLARNPEFQQLVFDVIKTDKSVLLGSTGSRLLSGNSEYVERLEMKICTVHRSDSAVLFASGYLANLCVFSCVPQRGDTVLLDESVHRSVRDGCRLSKAVIWKFKHNDLNHLEQLLLKTHGSCYVAIESLYSMDGSFAPIKEIVALCNKYNALLIVDEAHAFGVFGWGLIDYFKLQKSVFAVVVTYGKAMGCQGAAVLGSQLLKDIIINFGGPFIYTTSPSIVQWIAIDQGYDFIAKHRELAVVLQSNIRLYTRALTTIDNDMLSPIQSVVVAGNIAVKAKAASLVDKGILVYAILSPTVPVGKERLRICLHSFNSNEEIEKLVDLLKI